MRKVGIFISGRLHSERLPNKLILPLGNSNLWDIACKKLQKISRDFNVYAMCCDKELINIAKKYPNIKVVIREKGTAEVDMPMGYVFKDVDKMEDDFLFFLNPCLSFLTSNTILRCMYEFAKSDKNYATSVKPFKNWLFESNGKPVTNIQYNDLNTKTVKTYWQMAHCFHVFEKKQFLKDGYMLKEDFLPLKIPYEEAIDIDTRSDYEYAKFLWDKS